MYKMSRCSKDKLEKLGFRHDYKFSNKDETYYYYRFDVYFYRNEVPLIEAEFMVCLETKEVEINVYDRKTRSRYASWYLNGNTLGFEGKSSMIDDINKKIGRKMKVFGIKEVKFV